MESLEDDSIEDVDVGDDGSSSFAKTSSQDLDVGQADGCFCKISSNGKLSWLRIQESLRLLSQLSIAARKTRAPHSSPVDCAGPMSDPVSDRAHRATTTRTTSLIQVTEVTRGCIRQVSSLRPLRNSKLVKRRSLSLRGREQRASASSIRPRPTPSRQTRQTKCTSRSGALGGTCQSVR